jgi:hypothetical protein
MISLLQLERHHLKREHDAIQSAADGRIEAWEARAGFQEKNR